MSLSDLSKIKFQIHFVGGPFCGNFLEVTCEEQLDEQITVRGHLYVLSNVLLDLGPGYFYPHDEQAYWHDGYQGEPDEI